MKDPLRGFAFFRAFLPSFVFLGLMAVWTDRVLRKNDGSIMRILKNIKYSPTVYFLVVVIIGMHRMLLNV
jgi:hypothetical protein